MSKGIVVRRIVGLLTAFSLAAAGVATAAPAQAAANPSSVTFTCTGGPNSDRLESSAAGVSGAAGDTVTVINNSGDTITLRNASGGNSLSPSTIGDLQQGTWTLGFGQFQEFVAGGATCVGDASIGLTITGGGGGGGGGSSSSSAAPEPALETLTLEVSTSNTTCTGGSPTGYSGSWLQLPAADACSQSGPNANPDSMLLGWATSSSFPIEIAQRQVNNGWGAYEIFNDDGQLTGVFIPAGGWTFVSASGNLYPIWSS